MRRLKSIYKKNGGIDEDSSINYDKLSLASSDSTEKKRNPVVKENSKNTKITNRSK